MLLHCDASDFSVTLIDVLFLFVKNGVYTWGYITDYSQDSVIRKSDKTETHIILQVSSENRGAHTILFEFLIRTQPKNKE